MFLSILDPPLKLSLKFLLDLVLWKNFMLFSPEFVPKLVPELFKKSLSPP